MNICWSCNSENIMIKVFLVYFAVFPLLRASIYLYISESEVERLLGVKAEMKYITDGVVNEYSSKFLLRVTQNISDVAFTWRSTVPGSKYGYSMHTKPDDGVLPVLRIPRQGFIPNKTEVFIVEYRCSKPGQFEVALYIDIAYPSKSNRTNVILKQQKLCANENQPFGIGAENNSSDGMGVYTNSKTLLLTGENVFYVVIVCVLAVVLVIIVLLIIYFKSSQNVLLKYRIDNINTNQTLQQRVSRNYANPCTAADSTLNLLSAMERRRDHYTGAFASFSVMPQLIYEKPFVLDVVSTLNELHIDKKFFEVLPLHEFEGTFGEVKWAILRKNDGKSGTFSADEETNYDNEVMLVKTLKSTADIRQLNIFLEQSLRFYHIPRFAYLAQVEAAAFSGLYSNREKSVDFPLICYNHQGYGILKRFLQRCRNDLVEKPRKETVTNSSRTLRTHELVLMAIQILKAVLHLHKYSIIHKDVATRNCLVSEIDHTSDRFFVQLCDAALSKDLFPNDYHCLGDNENRPVKWMAYESLRSNLYNSATDAWSFGVTLWELLSCGQQPYADVNPDEMLSLLSQGHRLPQPYNCPDELYSVMYCCWQLDYRERPTCGQLLNTLQNFMLQLRQFI